MKNAHTYEKLLAFRNVPLIRKFEFMKCKETGTIADTTQALAF